MHQRQKLSGMALAQPGDKQNIAPAADEGIRPMDVFLCIPQRRIKIQVRSIADELVGMPPVGKEQILMDECHPLLCIPDLIQSHIVINPVKLLLVQDVRAQCGHIGVLLDVLPDQPVHVPGFIMLRQRVQILLYLFFGKFHVVSSR